MLSRAVIIDEHALIRLHLLGEFDEDWIGAFPLDSATTGLTRIEIDNLIYLISPRSRPQDRLLIVKGSGRSFFPDLPAHGRLDCFFRLVRAGLSRFNTTIRLPLDWRVYHSESIISFQTNSKASKISGRAYVDYAPANTDHVYAYDIDASPTRDLDRKNFDQELLENAVLRFQDALTDAKAINTKKTAEANFDFDRIFSSENIAQGIPFAVWRDSKLTRKQKSFFDADFDGPLRVRGPAGTGKTLVLALRFLKEIYTRIDNEQLPVRAAFLAHGQETANHIQQYLMFMDERGIITNPSRDVDLHITTLHGIANNFINYDVDDIEPLSLDGSQGRQMQFELVAAVKREQDLGKFSTEIAGCGDSFLKGLLAKNDSDAGKSFCCDLIDEFATVVETLGARDVDDISDRYTKSAPTPRSLARNSEEKQIVLEIYRAFRQLLQELRVVSLDQFTADFVAYLNSFRWTAVRAKRGFDFVFADELHLFNRQERPVLGYILREKIPARVAVAYDPRQSPRNTFFPHATKTKDAIWKEANLLSNAEPFDFSEVFRYTPQITKFLQQLNSHFPADDLAEEWGITFGSTIGPAGESPVATLVSSMQGMADTVSRSAIQLSHTIGKRNRVAVLCLDQERFDVYCDSGMFRDRFALVRGRDETAIIHRYAKRAVLSMPEYVAGLQFDYVLLIDANAHLVNIMGSPPSGLQRFISGVYLGASRAKSMLHIYADQSAGGFAEPIRDALETGTVIPS